MKKGVNPKNLDEFAEVAKKNYYTKEKKLGSKINYPSGNYQKRFDKLIEDIGDNSALSNVEKQDLISKMDLYRGDANSGKLNASKLTQRDKEINALYPKLRGSANYVPRQYINEAKEILNDTATSIGKKHKSWYKNWQGAKDIHKAQNFTADLSDMAQESPKIAKQLSKPLLKQLLGIPAAVVGAAAEPVIEAGKTAVNKGQQIYGFYKYPAGQKLLKEFYILFPQICI